jgi:nitrite reductase/ring-hydroxylating ferredoxin subunit
VDRYVDSLLRRRRPKPFAPTEDDIALARAAIDLVQARPDATDPRPGFADELRRRLAAQDTAPEAAPSLATTRFARARRRMLQAAALAASAGAGIAADRVITGRGSGPTASTKDDLTPSNGDWQTVAATSDLPEGTVLPFDLGTVSGFVRRVSGQVHAISGICTHQGCRLSLATGRDTLACPCHGATFTLAGQSLTHPRSTQALRPLPALRVREQHGQIQVYAPANPPA